MNPGNVVISAATGYGPNQLMPFVCSLMEYVINVKLIIIIQENQMDVLKAAFKDFSDVEFVVVSLRRREWSYLNRLKLFWQVGLGRWGRERSDPGKFLRECFHISVDRYCIARDILRACDAENVLLADSRDVIFQSDPFALLAGRMVTGLEPAKISDCEYNKNWIRSLYGEHNLDEIGNNFIACSGVSLGPKEAMIAYLDAMIFEFIRRIRRFDSVGVDQGVHNYLIYKKSHPLITTRNSEGWIATLHHECAEDISIRDGKIYINNTAPAVVHQYDRHRKALEAVNEHYSPD